MLFQLVIPAMLKYPWAVNSEEVLVGIKKQLWCLKILIVWSIQIQQLCLSTLGNLILKCYSLYPVGWMLRTAPQAVVQYIWASFDIGVNNEISYGRDKLYGEIQPLLLRVMWWTRRELCRKAHDGVTGVNALPESAGWHLGGLVMETKSPWEGREHCFPVFGALEPRRSLLYGLVWVFMQFWRYFNSNLA